MKISGWAIAAGAAVGGMIGYAIVSDARTQALLEDLRKKGVPLRLPDPSYAMQLPKTQADFDHLEDLLCAQARVAPADEGDDAQIEFMARTVAADLFPDFPWPPIPGDHPSASELWADLHLLARRALATGACQLRISPP